MYMGGGGGGSERSGVDNLTAGFSYVLLFYSHELRYHDTYLGIARTNDLLDTILQPANSSVASSVMNDVVNTTLEGSRIEEREGEARQGHGDRAPLAHLSAITYQQPAEEFSSFPPPPPPPSFPSLYPQFRRRNTVGAQVYPLTYLHPLSLFFYFVFYKTLGPRSHGGSTPTGPPKHTDTGCSEACMSHHSSLFSQMHNLCTAMVYQGKSGAGAK